MAKRSGAKRSGAKNSTNLVGTKKDAALKTEFDTKANDRKKLTKGTRRRIGRLYQLLKVMTNANLTETKLQANIEQASDEISQLLLLTNDANWALLHRTLRDEVPKVVKEVRVAIFIATMRCKSLVAHVIAQAKRLDSKACNTYIQEVGDSLKAIAVAKLSRQMIKVELHTLLTSWSIAPISSLPQAIACSIMLGDGSAANNLHLLTKTEPLDGEARTIIDDCPGLSKFANQYQRTKTKKRKRQNSATSVVNKKLKKQAVNDESTVAHDVTVQAVTNQQLCDPENTSQVKDPKDSNMSIGLALVHLTDLYERQEREMQGIKVIMQGLMDEVSQLGRLSAHDA